MDIRTLTFQVADWFEPVRYEADGAVLKIRKDGWPLTVFPMAIVEGMALFAMFNMFTLATIIIAFVPPVIILLGRTFYYVVTVDKKRKTIGVLRRSLFLKSSKQFSLEGFDCLTLEGDDRWNRADPKYHERDIILNTKTQTTKFLTTSMEHAPQVVGWMNDFLFDDDDSTSPT